MFKFSRAPASEKTLSVDRFNGLTGELEQAMQSLIRGQGGKLIATNFGGSSVVTRGATWVSTVALVTPINDVPVVIPTNCTLKEVVILTLGGPGSCTVDIWKKAYGSYPPTVADTIVSGGLPTISSGTTYQNTTLAGWTTSFAQDDVLMLHLATTSVFTLVEIQLRMQ